MYGDSVRENCRRQVIIQFVVIKPAMPLQGAIKNILFIIIMI